LGWVALGATLLATIGGHVLREAAQVAVVLACVQALASGALLWSTMPRRLRWLGPAAATVLLTGIGLGAWVSPQTGAIAAAGLSHALLYGALLFVFARSLRPGRTAVVTRLARRTNPHFRAEMVPYTRKVTLAWGLFAGAQLAASAVLLGAGMLGPWLLLVGVLHAPLAAGLAIGEYLVRCWRFPGEHTNFADTIRGIRGGGLGS
jgi:uncharacterized membrane protein